MAYDGIMDPETFGGGFSIDRNSTRVSVPVLLIADKVTGHEVNTGQGQVLAAAIVGVPLITPVAVLMVNPRGKPLAAKEVVDGLAAIVVVNGTPTVPKSAKVVPKKTGAKKTASRRVMPF